MSELHLPWLEAAVLIPLVGAIWVSRLRNHNAMRIQSAVFSGITFLCTVGAWQDFDWLHASQADDRWHLLAGLVGREVFVIDQLSGFRCCRCWPCCSC